MTPNDLRLLARALAKYRHSEARVDLGGAVAMVTLDICDEFRKNDPDFEYLAFWTVVDQERREAKRLDDEWLAQARARRETK